jgi:hypothetical protein
MNVRIFFQILVLHNDSLAVLGAGFQGGQAIIDELQVF